MTIYGWYYDGGGTIQDESDDVWDLIGRAVPEAAMDGRLHALMVGEMYDCSVDDPPRCCLGRDPLPIEYVEGEWVYGGSEEEPAAYITYATSPKPEWVWWVLGRMGAASSLKEAMVQAMAELDRRTA
jgi:hypothetical protein